MRWPYTTTFIETYMYEVCMIYTFKFCECVYLVPHTCIAMPQFCGRHKKRERCLVVVLPVACHNSACNCQFILFLGRCGAVFCCPSFGATSPSVVAAYGREPNTLCMRNFVLPRFHKVRPYMLQNLSDKRNFLALFSIVLVLCTVV